MIRMKFAEQSLAFILWMGCCWVEYVIKDVHESNDDHNAKEHGATSDAFRRKSAEAPCLDLCCCTFKIHDENESGTTPSAFI